MTLPHALTIGATVGAAVVVLPWVAHEWWITARELLTPGTTPEPDRPLAPVVRLWPEPADNAGITPAGCWATVWSDRRHDYGDCGHPDVDQDGLCTPHSAVLAGRHA